MKWLRMTVYLVMAFLAIFPHVASAGRLSVQTSNATNVTSTSAVLEAYATGFTGDATIGFDWGQENLDSETANETVSVAGEKVRIRISGLAPSTRYTFRARGVANDEDDEGITLSFTTLKEGAMRSEEEDLYKDSARKDTGNALVQFADVITLTPSAVYGNSATLRGFANTHGAEDARQWFQYGVRGGELVPSRSRILPEGDVAFSGEVWGLIPNTEYEYRAVVETDLGISLGEVVRFRTVGSTSVRTEPYHANDIAISDGVLDSENFSSPVVRATVWTAGSPVRVKVEYGSTRAMSHETAYQYVAQSGEVRIPVEEMKAGRTYYYRTYVEDGQAYVRGEIVSVRIPRASERAAAVTKTEKEKSSGSVWTRLKNAFKGEKSSSSGIVRDVAREDALVLTMTVEKNGIRESANRVSADATDILTFSFMLTDIQERTTGVLSFTLPEGCTYLSSDNVPYVRAETRVYGEVTYTPERAVGVRCIVDDVKAVEQVYGTFAVDSISVTSNQVALNATTFALGALVLGVFRMGTSMLVLILVATIALALVIIRLHDRTMVKKPA